MTSKQQSIFSKTMKIEKYFYNNVLLHILTYWSMLGSVKANLLDRNILKPEKQIHLDLMISDKHYSFLE
jgi:hypothetical protein